MQFSDTTNKNGIIQDAEFLLNFPDGGISGDTTVLKQFTGLINQAYLKVVAKVLEADRRWTWDHSNYTDFPIGSATLVAGQEDYTLPAATSSGNAATLLRVVRIAVLDTTGVEYTLIHDERPIADLNKLYVTSGTPVFYKLIGNSVKLFPAPAAANVTLTAGLRVYFQRSPDLFTSSDTTQQPGLPEPLHRLLSIEASMDYASSRGLPNVEYLQTKATEMYAILDAMIPDRNRDAKPRLTPRVETYR